jgi:GDP-mannose transporter
MSSTANKPLLGEGEQKRSTTGATSAFSGTSLIIVYYAICSGCMLVVNKVAIVHLQAPTFLLCAQLGFTAFIVRIMAAWGALESDALEWSKVYKFLPVALGFSFSVFANMKVLQYANVDTFITFR